MAVWDLNCLGAQAQATDGVPPVAEPCRAQCLSSKGWNSLGHMFRVWHLRCHTLDLQGHMSTQADPQQVYNSLPRLHLVI